MNRNLKKNKVVYFIFFISLFAITCKKEETIKRTDNLPSFSKKELELKWAEAHSGRWYDYIFMSTGKESASENIDVFDHMTTLLSYKKNAESYYKNLLLTTYGAGSPDNIENYLDSIYPYVYAEMEMKMEDIKYMDNLLEEYKKITDDLNLNQVRAATSGLKSNTVIEPVAVTGCGIPSEIVELRNRLEIIAPRTYEVASCRAAAMRNIAYMLDRIYNARNLAECSTLHSQARQLLGSYSECMRGDSDPIDFSPPGWTSSGGVYRPVVPTPDPPTAQPIPANAQLPYQSNPAIEIGEYLDCFRNISNAGAKYKVTLYVQEPQPGMNFHYGVNGVGHVSIGLTKTGANGESITQVIGYYPIGENIFEEVNRPAKLVDNGNANKLMSYTVKMDFDMGSDITNFQKILGFMSVPKPVYNAFHNNCVTFAYQAATSGGLQVPFRISTIDVPISGTFAPPYVPIFAAYTPAGMAQEMRKAQAAGDSRVQTAANATVAQSKGPC